MLIVVLRVMSVPYVKQHNMYNDAYRDALILAKSIFEQTKICVCNIKLPARVISPFLEYQNRDNSYYNN